MNNTDHINSKKFFNILLDFYIHKKDNKSDIVYDENSFLSFEIKKKFIKNTQDPHEHFIGAIIFNNYILAKVFIKNNSLIVLKDIGSTFEFVDSKTQKEASSVDSYLKMLNNIIGSYMVTPIQCYCLNSPSVAHVNTISKIVKNSLSQCKDVLEAYYVNSSYFCTKKDIITFNKIINLIKNNLKYLDSTFIRQSLVSRLVSIADSLKIFTARYGYYLSCFEESEIDMICNYIYRLKSKKSDSVTINLQTD